MGSFVLNLEARAVSKKSAPKLQTDNKIAPEAKPQKLGRKARFKALLLDKNFEQENPKNLEELTDETCRWPKNSKDPYTFGIPMNFTNH